MCVAPPISKPKNAALKRAAFSLAGYSLLIAAGRCLPGYSLPLPLPASAAMKFSSQWMLY